MTPTVNIESTIDIDTVIDKVKYRDSGFRLDIYVTLKEHKYLDYTSLWTGGPDYSGTVIEFTPFLYNDENEEITDIEEILRHPDYFKLNISFDDKDYADYFVTPLKYEYRISFIKSEDFNIKQEECDINIWE